MEKTIAPYEIPDGIDYSKLFLGRVYNVDTVKMQIDVEVDELPGQIITGLNIPVMYSSFISNSGMFTVPRNGDYVLLAKRQAIWECVGCANISVIVDKTTSMSLLATLQRMHNSDFASTIKDATAKEFSAEALIPDLGPGDFGTFVRNKDKSVDFLMLTNGKMILSAGMAYLVLNQIDRSIRALADFFMVVTGDGKTKFEFGSPQTPFGVTPPADYLIKFGNSLRNEFFEMGYVNTAGVADTGMGGTVRARLRVGTAIISIMQDGSIDIKTISDISATSRNMQITNTRTDIKSTNVTINGKSFVLTENDITVNCPTINVNSENVKINGVSIEAGGLVPLILSTCIPILMAHTHPVNIPQATALPSLNLVALPATATKIVKGA
jgi:hypothetical protein